MLTIGVVERAALALLQCSLALARLFPGDPSSALVHGTRLLDVSLFFARLPMAGLLHALPDCPYEHWNRSGERNLQLSVVVALVFYA